VINVVNWGFVIAISVDVTLYHTYIGDLIVTLFAPNGASVILHNRSNGTTDNIIGNYPDSIVPFQSLSAFNGLQVQGTWRLRVSDNAAIDLGNLNSWRLSFLI
jgi:subtilisin-like proprotein convertase family protein